MELEKRIEAALFHQLVANSAIPLIGSAIGSLLVAVSQLGSSRSDVILGWLCLVYATLGLRFWFSSRCRKALETSGYTPQTAIRYAASVGLSGIAWGLGGLLIKGASPVAMIVTITAIQAMVMGGVLMLGAFIPAFLAFTLPAILPMIIMLALGGGVENNVLALYSSIFLALMIGIALRFNQSLHHTWRLTFEKEDLVNSLTQTHTFLRESQSLAGLGSYVLDFSTGIWKSSDILDQLFGINQAYERTIDGWEALIHPDDRDMMKAHLTHDVLSNNLSFDKEYRLIRHDDAAVRWLHGLGKLELDAQGRPLRMLGTIQDITDRKMVERELRIAAIAFETQEGLMVTDANDVIIRVNQAFTDITGYLADEVIGQTPRLLKSGVHDATFYATMWKSIEQTGAWQGEVWNRRKNGELFPEQLTITAVKGGDQGEITHYVATMNDITKRKQIEEQIHLLAFHDALTGLPNRRLLDDRLQQAMATCKRTGHYAALMFLDLDNFKPLNDKHGHSVGDLLLVEAAHRLRSCVRETDSVARFGGDEFVVLLVELERNSDEAKALSKLIAEKLLSRLAEPYLLTIQQEDGTELLIEHHCTSSIGVTLFNNHSVNHAEILKCADMAMYQAKDQGRNLIHFYASGEGE